MTASQKSMQKNRRRRAARRGLKYLSCIGVLTATVAAVALWLGSRASIMEDELNSAAALLPQLETALLQNDPNAAAVTVEELRDHTGAARSAAQDPIWVLSSSVPWLGPNFHAASEVATSADDVSRLAAAPLVSAFQSLDWATLLPSGGGVDIRTLADAQPQLASAAHAVRESSNRLLAIDAEPLLPQVSEPLIEARDQLGKLRTGLDAAANVSSIVPNMMGAEGARNYLLMIQNNAELRATGGISGALAVLTVDQGKLSLGEQKSAGSLGAFTPPLEVDPEQQAIYSQRVGKYMQDVNLTPDFPTAAMTAQTMWERKTGQRVDGVISIDPVALAYILEATGSVNITDTELLALASQKLPTELTGKNIAQTLLSDVYAQIEQPALQDAYFAGVAQEIFAALADGKGNAKGIIEGLTRGTSEGRVLAWSGLPAEQAVIAGYAISGSIAGPSVAPAQFGVYFNDGTGAKMDYYVKRTVQLVKECPRDGYEQTTVRITSTNTAPADAATSLPAYVTGAGNYGIPPGTVQTNVISYGPVQANAETAKLDGQKTQFAPYLHSNRPVGVLAIQLAPGESKTIEFTFGKIVQHSEPNLVVTPTVESVRDVILPTKPASCS